jgi:hypothetical protein
MAEAKMGIMQVTKMVEVNENVSVVDLRLSIHEAQFLRDVMRRIGGDPHNSPRKYADNIDNILSELKINLNELAFKSDGNRDLIYYNAW